MSRSLSLLRTTLGLAGGARGGSFRAVGEGEPEQFAARLEMAVVRGDTGHVTPARVYLFKEGKPFRLRPVDVMLPLRVDLFYRERLWRRPPRLDDHIHLTRAAEDDEVFLRWLQADDLSVGNFLQLQRQVDAAVQYAFGREREATAPGVTIRSGQESRSEFYGHINLLGPRRLLRPVSVGMTYANTPEAYPFPNRLFAEERALGAAVGYAHFDGAMKHSTLPLDLALGAIDFISGARPTRASTAHWNCWRSS